MKRLWSEKKLQRKLLIENAYDSLDEYEKIYFGISLFDKMVWRGRRFSWHRRITELCNLILNY